MKRGRRRIQGAQAQGLNPLGLKPAPAPARNRWQRRAAAMAARVVDVRDGGVTIDLPPVGGVDVPPFDIGEPGGGGGGGGRPGGGRRRRWRRLGPSFQLPASYGPDAEVNPWIVGGVDLSSWPVLGTIAAAVVAGAALVFGRKGRR